MQTQHEAHFRGDTTVKSVVRREGELFSEGNANWGGGASAHDESVLTRAPNPGNPRALRVHFICTQRLGKRKEA